jgi:hypothetical protein
MRILVVGAGAIGLFWRPPAAGGPGRHFLGPASLRIRTHANLKIRGSMYE